MNTTPRAEKHGQSRGAGRQAGSSAGDSTCALTDLRRQAASPPLPPSARMPEVAVKPLAIKPRLAVSSCAPASGGA
jgi:hypothetical protein